MGGKHLKRLRAEKAKVKLKKKPLPKGQNVTNTSFKVKKIVVASQLQSKSGSEVVSSKNQNLKELLHSLNHYNTAHRLNGLAGLKEIIRSHPQEILLKKLRDVITGLVVLLLDVEDDVRKATVALIHEICEMLIALNKQDQLRSLYDLLHVHINCAMTHINPSVQADSLLLLDVYILYLPDLIRENFKTIIYNFLNLISKSKSEGSAERTLNLNLNSKLSGIHQRAKVFYYLAKIFDIVYQTKDEGRDSKVEEFIVDENKFNFIPFRDYDYNQVPNISFFCKTFASRDLNLPGQEKLDIKSNITTIMPILFETVLEVSSNSNKTMDVETNVKLMVLSFILKIIKLFWMKLLQMDQKDKSKDLQSWFCNEYKKQIVSDLLHCFPLSSVSTPKRKQSTVTYSSDIVSDNIALCYLYFCLGIKIKQIEELMVTFITECLQNANDEVVPVVGLVIRGTGKITRTQEVILSEVVKTYKTSTNTRLRGRLFDILKEVSLSEQLQPLRSVPVFQEWLKYLPQELCNKELSGKLVGTVLKLAAVNESVRNSIQKYLFSIITLLNDMTIDGYGKTQGQKLVINLLYWCKVDVIQQLVDDNIFHNISDEVKQYAFSILSYKHPNIKF